MYQFLEEYKKLKIYEEQVSCLNDFLQKNNDWSKNFLFLFYEEAMNAQAGWRESDPEWLIENPLTFEAIKFASLFFNFIPEEQHESLCIKYLTQENRLEQDFLDFLKSISSSPPLLLSVIENNTVFNLLEKKNLSNIFYSILERRSSFLFKNLFDLFKKKNEKFYLSQIRQIINFYLINDINTRPLISSLETFPDINSNFLLGMIYLRLKRQDKREEEHVRIMIQNPENLAILRKTPSVLHSILYYSFPIFKELYSLLEANENSCDQMGRNFVFYCKTHVELELLVNFLPTINLSHQDNNGNTALHLCAQRALVKEASFLLSKGALTDLVNKEGFTFWSVPTEGVLAFYQQFKKNNGLALRPYLMPFHNQRGNTCGFYAAYYVKKFLFSAYPEAFKSPPLPARKGDTEPKASQSLLSLRHTLNIKKTTGPLFSTEELGEVILATECNYSVINIGSYEEFIAVIQRSLAQNCPIIIPFSLSKEKTEDNEFKARGAHWAVIVGWMADHILLAQFARYEAIEAHALFDQFYNIEAHFPGAIIDKEEIPSASLKYFRRRLMIISAPGYTVDLNTDHAKNPYRLFNMKPTPSLTQPEPPTNQRATTL